MPFRITTRVLCLWGMKEQKVVIRLMLRTEFQTLFANTTLFQTGHLYCIVLLSLPFPHSERVWNLVLRCTRIHIHNLHSTSPVQVPWKAFCQNEGWRCSKASSMWDMFGFSEQKLRDGANSSSSNNTLPTPLWLLTVYVCFWVNFALFAPFNLLFSFPLPFWWPRGGQWATHGREHAAKTREGERWGEGGRYYIHTCSASLSLSQTGRSLPLKTLIYPAIGCK